MLQGAFRCRKLQHSFDALLHVHSQLNDTACVCCSPLYKNNVALLNDNPYVFVQVDGVEQQRFGGSYINVTEANSVVELVKQLQRPEDASWSSPEKIRIITFYQAQASLLKRLLSERGLGTVVVATVDSSQGCEADIVIGKDSCVSLSPQPKYPTLLVSC